MVEWLYCFTVRQLQTALERQVESEDLTNPVPSLSKSNNKASHSIHVFSAQMSVEVPSESQLPSESETFRLVTGSFNRVRICSLETCGID